jgi:Mn2+/Fe2+ NRAMP family transporter
MLGLIGCIIMPHNLYLHSSLVHERKIDRDNRQSVKVRIASNLRKLFYITTLKLELV